jgi:hypothetical protein
MRGNGWGAAGGSTADRWVGAGRQQGDMPGAGVTDRYA